MGLGARIRTPNRALPPAESLPVFSLESPPSCEAADGTKISVRTVVLYDADNRIITADRYEGKTIDVRGIVDYYSGDYQIKVFSDSDITIH